MAAFLPGAMMMALIILLSGCSVSHGLTTRDDSITAPDGTVIKLKGFTWFGFNNGQTMLDGLWNGATTLQGDFSTVVYRQQLMGFNAVRLPFSFKDLNGLTPRTYYTRSCTVSTNAQVGSSVVPPGTPIPAGSPPPPISPVTGIGAPSTGSCNAYYPNNSVLDRFVWVANYFARNGFYVLIDNHFREDQTATQNKALWLDSYAALVTRLSAEMPLKDKLMIDILNEPDNYGDLYLSAMDRLYPINPQALFFVEGTGQGGIGANWGDGFATDPSLITSSGLSDPNPFFRTLMGKPYLNQVVISPHIYGPTVTYASSGYSGTGLWTRLARSFGYLTKTGYTWNGVTKRFPVAVGEFGSKFIDPRDLDFMRDFASYLNNEGAAADGLHNAIPNWFYWSWNANSGDTGGLVADDWITLEWTKLAYLRDRLAVRPWYLSEGTTPAPTPSPISSPIPSPTPSPIPSPTPSPTPSPIPSPTPSPTPSPIIPPVSGPCSVRVQMGGAWQVGTGRYSNSMNVYVKNLGTNVVSSGWAIKLRSSVYVSASGAWNLALFTTTTAGEVGGTATASWQALQPNGAEVNVGFIITISSATFPIAATFKPSSALLNGMACSVTLTL